MDNVKDVFSHFNIEDKLYSFERNTTGHINRTYICTAVDERTNVKRKYTLQCINHNVFKNVEGVMDNIVKVTECIKSDSDCTMSLSVVRCNDGKPYYLDSNGEYWRMYNYISDVLCMDVLTSRDEAFLLGVAIADFQKKLSKMEVEKLCVTIPDFHNMEFRYHQFDEALVDAGKVRSERVKKAEREIEFFKARRKSSIAFFHDVCQKTPTRVTHNDAKLNNVLFSSDLSKSCVIDLDTVMPGSVLFDTGDMLRTVTNTAKEDERDLAKVSFNKEYYQSLKAGFFSIAESFLTDLEKDNFLNSGKYITQIVGLRFLNDYLMGDIYFHTEYEEHNLVRCRTQIRLIESMEACK